MALLLVRHARAGERGTHADDTVRPLDKKGRKQAERLAELLAERPVKRILSSPATRCTETMQPLGERTGLELETRDELAEGASAEELRSLIDSLEQVDGDVALCTHGDVIAELIGSDRPAKKGSVWVIETAHDLEPTEYITV